MTETKPMVRKGQYAGPLTREEFRLRFMRRFYDPAFLVEREALERLETIAWNAYEEGRKSPVTVKAGAGYADPDYDLSVEWKETRDRLERAAVAQRDPGTASRVLVVVGAARNDGTCPGEVSKSWRLAGIVLSELQTAGMQTDMLDLSRLTSEYQYQIHPCKGCVSTAMPLCHWPCSCYPNHSLGQDNDAMAGIYEQWVAAHGVILIAPTYWYQSPSPLKLMIDRLVCADGGNPDPTLTGGKDPLKAKQVELAGWPYPKHLAGRAYGLVVHGDVAGIESQRRALTDWLDWMGLIDAGAASRLDRYISYYRPYATSHDDLDQDLAVQQEVRNVARAMANFLPRLRQGECASQDQGIRNPRPK
ncbi:NADPH-dependent FMN reductase [Achromobacter xylosoxidans A8]|uniref:NADPH-dependent FMN reductase n=1 Tax=Achromobacter xylosoxidans (strain A8) TaxID=762376 RepID=E3HVV8_ACHXA|nr:NAD(P)H-dependent oxidoreductase [Achromobacter xylosoxidans]ADP16271.1 NADPH-dependent FMN reductase [Achromobacter xylosoxidans A8]